MKRTHFVAAGIALALAALVAPAARALDFPEPLEGSFTPAQLEQARADFARAPAGEGADADVLRLQESRSGPQRSVPGTLDIGRTMINEDNDSGHYARGRTLIVHIFVNHSGGTYSGTEMSARGAAAAAAKDFYTSHVPYSADLSFDHPGTTDYYYYVVTLPYAVGSDGMTDVVQEDVLSRLGATDVDGDGTIVDDFTIGLQNWAGGWDNVILCYDPRATGTNLGYYYYGKCVLYFGISGGVIAHEWGHVFGACDEYISGGHCNSTVDCGDCQSWFLDGMVQNSNCQLLTCPSHVSCIMADPSSTAICPYTLDHWAWTDGNSDGMLDLVKTRTTGSNFVNLWELWHNGYFYWNSVTDRMMFSQRSDAWAVVGLRSPATADYDLALYGDDNFNYLYANSRSGTGQVDFVVGDYNHSPTGIEHILLSHYSGDWAAYNLTWESGGEMLYPDGVARTESWGSDNVVRAWDVPLFAGEKVAFNLSNPGGGLDFGMALFKSNGDSYWAGRSAAAWTVDAGGTGVSESYVYTVPSDDVYGLVVWSNNAANGSVTLQIGPDLVALTEEVPFYSAYDLRLFSYAPNAGYWAFVGTRPDAGTGVSLRLFDDAQFTTELGNSSAYGDGAMEFMAVDHNHLAMDTNYLRVSRDLGAGNHRTEWEQNPDIISGAVDASWVAPHLGKMWDASLALGRTYFLREYHSSITPFDSGIYFFSSADGDRVKERQYAAALSNSHPAADGGEWVSFTPPASDWYGTCVIANDATSSGSYSLWLGRQENLGEAAQWSISDEILWGSCSVSSYYWTVFGVRPGDSSPTSVWLYGDPAYTIDNLLASDQPRADVRYVVGDWNHGTTGTYYPRWRRSSGTAAYQAQWEGGPESFAYTVGVHNYYDLTWNPGDVVKMWDVFVPAGKLLGVVTEDRSGQMDLGMELFKSNSAAYYAKRGQGVASSDRTGVGGAEALRYTSPAADWYGLVIYNKNANGGAFRVHIADESVVSVEEPAAAEFALGASPNPFVGNAQVRYSLPREGRADLAVYDLQGRRVRTLAQGAAPAGEHLATWDGRDEGGGLLPSGVYLVRLTADPGTRTVKIVHGR